MLLLRLRKSNVVGALVLWPISCRRDVSDFFARVDKVRRACDFKSPPMEQTRGMDQQI